MNVLAICGSIRESSSNYNLLLALKSFLPVSTSWNYFSINQLPFFDPQLQFDAVLAKNIQALRELAKNSDVMIISTPEYAHGIPGILKNALEWLVCEETLKKKVVLLIGSPSGGGYVKEYLTETIRTMDLLPSEERTLVVTTARSDIAADGKILNKDLQVTIAKFVGSFFYEFE